MTRTSTRFIGALVLAAALAGASGEAAAQARAPEILEIVPASLRLPGLSIENAGWRYAPGDDPGWADPAFDDAHWTRAASTWREPSLAAWPWTGIGWFRLHVRLAPDVVEPVALELRHLAASEVFVDGVKVGGFGTVGRTAEDERTLEPRGRAVVLPLRAGQVHVIAVRLSCWPLADGTRWARWFAATENFSPGLRIARLVSATDHAAARDRTHAGNIAIVTALTAVFASFGALHLLYFWLRRTDTDNLSFGTYALAVALIVGGELHRDLVGHSIWAGALFHVRGYVLLPVMAFSLVAYARAVMRKPVSRTALTLMAGQIVLAAAVLARPLAAFEPVHGVLQFGLLALAVLGAVTALRRRSPGAPLAAMAVFAGALPLVLTSLEAVGIHVAARTLFVFGGLAAVLAVVSGAQAWRFARTSARLQEQLDRVQELSARERERDLAEAAAQAERERERAEAERQAHELEQARVFQLSLLPARLPELVGWQAVASMQTATEVGGDYFDVRRMPDGIATLVIGDATGHGLRAGTLVATTKGLFQAVGDHEDLGAALQVMSAALRDLRLRGLFMALTIVRLHPDGRAELASAGMPPALLLGADGKIASIGEAAPPLGAPIRFRYPTREVQVRSGERLVLMTDGVPERLDAADELFGYARVPALAAAHRHRAGAEYIQALEAELDTFAGRPPADDATLMVIARQ